MKRIFIILILLLLLTGTASATTLWVRTDGSDSCNGQNNMSYAQNTTDCAWKTISRAVNVSGVVAGDTLRIQNGTYNEKVVTTNSGNVTHRINIIGDNNPIIDGGERNGSTLGSNDTGFLINSSYFTLSNISVRGFKSTGIVVNYGMHDVIISNNTVFDNGQYGITSRPYSYNVLIEYNIAHNNNMSNIALGGHDSRTNSNLVYQSLDYGMNMADYGMSTSTNNSYNNTFYGDRIYNNLSDVGIGGYGHGFGVTSSLTSIDPSPNNITIDGAYISGFMSAGVEVRDMSTNVTIKNSYFDGITGANGAVYFEHSSNYGLVENVIVDGTNYPSQKSYSTGSSRVGNTGNIMFKNCIAINVSTGNTNRATGFSIPKGVNISIINSVVYKGDKIADNNVGIDAGTNLSWGNRIIKNVIISNLNGTGIIGAENTIVSYSIINVTGTSILGATNSSGNMIKVDPLFVSPTDFHLRSQYGRWNGATWVYDNETSPAISAGDPTSDNSLSPWGGVIEMGAYGNTPYASKFVLPGTGGSISGYAKDVINGSFLAGSTAALYYSDGIYTGLSTPVGATGKFQFNNVSVGSYYVNVSKAEYFSNRSYNFSITPGATINAGNIALLDQDVNKDGNITVTDLNSLVNDYGIVDESTLKGIKLTEPKNLK